MNCPVRIVLVEPSHPGNIGAVARAMKNMGCEELWLVRPKQFPDPEASARAAGATDVLDAARVVGSIDEAIADCRYIAATTSRPRIHNWTVLTPRDLAQQIVACEGCAKAAVLFGSERFGLENDALQHCRTLVKIPVNPAYESLNLAMAVQIVCYEILLARTAPATTTQQETPPVTAEELERFYAQLAEVMDEADFHDRTGRGHLMTRIRRIFNRTALDQNELNILRGILTAVQGRRRAAGSGRKVS
ncbi:MAG TPA: RNA methyltransferase [Steroidobacteraceae bacterium]|nr:RNA methyltransferase [Steroidobacteraceae bacterium]